MPILTYIWMYSIIKILIWWFIFSMRTLFAPKILQNIAKYFSCIILAMNTGQKYYYYIHVLRPEFVFQLMFIFKK